MGGVRSSEGRTLPNFASRLELLHSDAIVVFLR